LTGAPFRPMLAASIDSEADLLGLRYPMIASPKVDGIRVLIHPELGPVTRSLKPIRNAHIREYLRAEPLHGLDGEIVIGDLRSPDSFNKTTAVMAREGAPDSFTYWVFDSFANPALPYVERDGEVSRQVGNAMTRYPNVRKLSSTLVRSCAEALQYESVCLAAGFEGIMLRHLDRPYKFNRSTLKEQGLLKLKRFADDEAVVTGFAPLMRNLNELQEDERGYAKRSSSQAFRVEAEEGLLGHLEVSHERWGSFAIGSGFDLAQRKSLWADRAGLVGRTVTFKYQETGSKDKPRFPIFLRFRVPE
jgi:DNA ligase-1